MHISQPEIKVDSQEICIEAHIESRFALQKPDYPQTLWFKFPRRYQNVVCNRSDAFIAALYQIAMGLGEDLSCDGEVSPRLLYGINEVQKTLIHWKPNIYKPIRITAANLVSAPPACVASKHMFTFSGGVDSFYSIWNNIHKKAQGGAFNLTHGIFIQGAVDIPLVYEVKFIKLENQYADLFHDLNMELITMRTNLLHFDHHLVPYNFFVNAPLVAGAMLLNPLISGLVVASSYDYINNKPDGASPLAVRPLCTENLDVIVSGYESNRFYKTINMADWPVAQQNLRVCIDFFHKDNKKNCSHCSKCLRTRIVLHISGKLERFTLFEPHFGIKDFLEWGRWLEIGYGWEFMILDYCWKHQKKYIPLVLIGMGIGYIRYFLRKILPSSIQKQIFKFTANNDPYELFTQ
mgnify:FL=1